MTPSPLPNNPAPPMPIQPDVSALGSSGNPVLDEISAAHANLSPQAQQAIEGAHGMLGISPAHSDPALAASTAPSPEVAVPGVSGPRGPLPNLSPEVPAHPSVATPKIQSPADSMVPGMVGVRASDIAPGSNDDLPLSSSPPAALNTEMPPTPGASASPPMPINPHQAEYERLTKPPLNPSENASAHTSADSGRPGYEQIHNPWLRGLATVGNVIASGVFPRFGQFLPGTSGYHNNLVASQKGALGEEQAGAKSAAEVAEAEARTKHDEAEAENQKQAGTFQTAGGGIYNLKTHEWEVEPPAKDKDHLLEIDPDKAKALGIRPNTDGKYYIPPQAAGELLKPVAAKEPKEGEIPLGDRVPAINAALRSRWQVLHPDTEPPAHYVLPNDATQKDFDRTDKLIEGEEKAFGTKENQNQTAELRKQTMALAAGNRENKEETGLKAATLKEFGPAVDSAERFNVMTKNYEDAVRNHDQQAMLSLLANHIGMTMGLQKGARINQAMYSEAQKSLPWLQGVQAKFDKDGYLSGVTLSPPQMQQMVSLGRERFSQDVTKARNNSKYLGAKDDGPERTPSKATINFYTSMAAGDAAKAKQLAAADGWSIQ